MAIFRNCFMLINKERRNIESELVYEKGGYRVSKMEQLTVRVNPNELLGMKELMLIIFDNRNIAVTQVALELIGFLFDHLDEDLADSLLEFKSRFLESCL